MLYMFRTLLVHHQEQLYKLYIALVYAGTIRLVQLVKVAPDDGLIQSETCTASNGKIKSYHKNSVQHATCMRHIFICGFSGSTTSSHVISKTVRFSKKKLRIKRVFWFSPKMLSETFLIRGRNERDMTKNVYWSSYKVSTFLVRF